MKLNKTLTMMKELNDNGSRMAIYGEKQYNKILNFKAVVSCDVNGSCRTFKLTDGSEIYAEYYDFC